MRQGTLELSTLIIIFICLQLWWIVPIIRNSKKQNIQDNERKNNVEKLERLFKMK